MTQPHHPTLRIVVVSASVREPRMGPTLARWVVDALEAGAAGPDVEVDLVDLGETDLPDDARLEPGGGPRSPVAERIEAGDAFVLVTPEYNHSYPASLKRLIDWHYREWTHKPATVVAYGVHGGHAAVEHLRGVLAELSMVTTRRCLAIAAPWEHLDPEGRFVPADPTTAALRSALAELGWWADLLGDARARRPFPAASEQTPGPPYVSINTFTPADGDLDALTDFQLAEMRTLGAEASALGWLGNEVYRAQDGTALIVVTRFASAAARDAWAATDRFRRHLEDLAPLVADVTPVPVTLVARHGRRA